MSPEPDPTEREDRGDPRPSKGRPGQSGPLKVQIQKIGRHGARVVLPDGEFAWLPAAELVADIKPGQDLREVSPFRPCDLIDAIIYGEVIHDRRRQKLVSHVRVENDPWREVATWPQETVKTMEVTLVTATRAIGTIAPGIRGQVFLDTLKPLFSQSWEGFARVLPGDCVAGYVNRGASDERQRILTLDVAGFVRDPVKITDALCRTLSAGTAPAGVDAPLSVRRGLRPALSTPIQRLLIVDEDVELTGSIKSYLDSVGCAVVAASSEQQGIDLLEGMPDPPDLVLVDVHLIDDSDGTGLRLAATIQADWPYLPIVLITGDDAFLDSRSRFAAEDLQVREVILKPLGIDELLRALESRNNAPQRLADFQPGDRVQASASRLMPDRWKEQLPGILRGLRAELRAESVVLFSIHPLFGKVEIVARDDPENLVSKVRPNIERSPVKDVAIEHEDVCTTDAVDSDSFPKHRWLQRAYDYRSCLAVPVHVPSEHAYALFAFHRQKEQFAPHRLDRMRLAAREAASILHVQRAERRLREMQPYELLGRAYGSMAHDLRGSLSVEFLTDGLLKVLRRQEPLLPVDLKEMREHVEALHEKLRRAAEIVHTFRQVARSGHEIEQEVDLLEVVPPFVKEMAAQENLIRREVVITGHVDAGYRVRIRPTGVKQILFNLILNAVQQIERFPLRKKACGEVLVELDQEIRGGRVWACIRVHDNGPGIHAADFERIFELGYSTKEEGFGMGLDICRQMAAGARVGDVCGEVRVRSSMLFVGTTLEASIPTKLIC